MKELKKDLYCKRCNTYPDEVNMVYEWATEKTKWNGEEYKQQDIDFGDASYECSLCGCILEWKSQEEENVAVLPEVQGEISKGENI